MSRLESIRRVFRRSPAPAATPAELAALAGRVEAMDVGLQEWLAELRAELHRESDRLRAESDSVRAHLDLQSAERVEALRTHAEQHAQEVVRVAIDRITARLARLEREHRDLGMRPSQTSTDVSPSMESVPPALVPAGEDAVDQPPSYAAFEEEMRGPSSLIRTLQAPYLADVAASPRPDLPVADIGCGRAEFVAMVCESGSPTYGVDLNETFASEAREQGLDIRLERGDLHLRSIPAGSLRGVTAFHVVEHLPMGAILELLDLAFRALTPGGVLILETPNPENLAVGANRFWLDPTHLRPLPPMLLAFLVREAGFEEVEVRRLHPLPPAIEPSLASDRASRAIIEVVNEALTGPVDYAVVARRAAD